MPFGNSKEAEQHRHSEVCEVIFSVCFDLGALQEGRLSLGVILVEGIYRMIPSLQY